MSPFGVVLCRGSRAAEDFGKSTVVGGRRDRWTLPTARRESKSPAHFVRWICLVVTCSSACVTLVPSATASISGPGDVDADRQMRIGDPLPAVRSDTGVDIAQLRTRRSQTFHAAHGSYRTRMFAESVNYKDESGQWRPIDNTLTVDGHIIRNTANRYQLSIPRTLAAGSIQVRHGDAWIEFSPRGASGVVETHGPMARVRDAWPGAELRWTATGDGVREEILLADPTAVRDFSFDVRLPQGFTPFQGRSGAVVVRDASDRPRLRLSPSLLIDAAGAVGAADAALQRTSMGWAVKVTPDRRWLTASQRRWPVTVDPTVIVDAALSCTIYSGESSSGGGTCEEGGGSMMVGEGVCSNSCASYRGLVNFDVAEAMPPGAVIEFASLQISGAPVV